ncbi:TetR/AcrR family transcriptional regulator [Geomesophilobacter sediminis]|uniref:TetR/AcrR family transcriptional regulator n=1 Tax=Geomesophilobacter sediminis TaxID=2798584 RepID=A0A8J7JK52_9BACT|nr:TetR/AcrR family transcriptional regulator [Geomesophilobacter sediminis]MBJ6723590.1 TetR/AcrR family transcriptional regulator [Geomesophilobacter sediminis]
MSPRNTQFSRDDIIEAAFQLVREMGWEGFSVVAVAKSIGSSTMPVYSQFSNVRELEDEVCRKAMALMKEHLLVDRTGDRWIDQAVSYVNFAVEERHLFRCLGDGRNLDLQKELGMGLVEFLDQSLADYPLFAGLNDMEFRMIRMARMMFAQRLAHWLNNDIHFLNRSGLETEDFIRRSSRAIYDGFMLQFGKKTTKPGTINHNA